MTEESIKQFLRDVNAKKVKRRSYDGSSYDTELIEKEGQTIFEDMLRRFLKEEDNKVIATLEAKVFVYEEIIRKSTFAPILSHPPMAKPL